MTQGSKPVAEFLYGIKALADELAIIGAPQGDVDLLIYCLRGLGPNFREIVAAIRARDTPITFEELHDKLVEHEDFLKRAEVPTEASLITANYTCGANSQNSQTKPHNNNYKGGKKQPIQQNRSLLPFPPNSTQQSRGLLPFPPNPNQIDPRQ